jgi:hypothetical protein
MRNTYTVFVGEPHGNTSCGSVVAYNIIKMDLEEMGFKVGDQIQSAHDHILMNLT